MGLSKCAVRKKMTKQQLARCKEPVEDEDTEFHETLLADLQQRVEDREPPDAILSWLKDRLLLTRAEHDARVRLCLEIQGALRVRLPTCLVQPFGSSVSNLGFHGCDLDIYVYLDDGWSKSLPYVPGNGPSKVRCLAKILQRYPHLCQKIIRIPHARVPIVKFESPMLDGAGCDISFGNPMACQNSRLLGWFMETDVRVRLVTVAVRYWAKRRNLAGGVFSPLKLSSYTLTLLVITFLQQLDPPLLPSVHWCQEGVPPMMIDNWNAAFRSDPAPASHCTKSPHQLLRDFFRYYADLCLLEVAVCPLLGGCPPRRILADKSTARTRSAPIRRYFTTVRNANFTALALSTPLVVQDPFELNFNTARNVRAEGLQRFQQACAQAVDLPLAVLFEFQPLEKLSKSKRKEAARVAEAAVSAAVKGRPLASVGLKRERLVSGGSTNGGGRAKQARSEKSANDKPVSKPKDSRTPANEKQVPKAQNSAVSGSEEKTNGVSAETVPRVPPSEATAAEPSSSSQDKPAPQDSEDDCMVEVVESTEAETNSNPSKHSRTTDAKQTGAVPKAKPNPAAPRPPKPEKTKTGLERALAQLQKRPCCGELVMSDRSVADEELVMLQARALARMVQDIFTRILLFDCTTLSFDVTPAERRIVAGFQCQVRFSVWSFRKRLTAETVRPAGKPSLAIEAEISQKVLQLLPEKERGNQQLAAFTCYVLVDRVRQFGEDPSALDQLVTKVCLYKEDTKKTGRACLPFVASFLKAMAKRVNYTTLYPDSDDSAI